MAAEGYEPGEVWDDRWYPAFSRSTNVKAFRRAGVDGQDLEVIYKSSRTQPERLYYYSGAGGEYGALVGWTSRGQYVNHYLKKLYGGSRQPHVPTILVYGEGPESDRFMKEFEDLPNSWRRPDLRYGGPEE